jgi:hypothetical protein
MSDTPDQKKKRGYLKTAFKMAATYIWPFHVRLFKKPKEGECRDKNCNTYKQQPKPTLPHMAKDAVGVVAKLMFVLPAKVGAVILAHQLIQPALGNMFPTAEEYLEEQGIDPKVAEILSDTEIRVRERDFWGKLHAANDIPTALGAITTLMALEHPGQAYASRGLLIDQCRVMLQEKDVTARDFISMLSGIPVDRIENIPMSDKESRLTVAFHEFAHCDSENSKDFPPIPESDADFRAALQTMEVLDNTEIAKTLLYARAMSKQAHDHDTALYLDAKLRGVDAPKAAEMTEPTDHAFKLAEIYVARNMAGDFNPHYVKTAKALQAVLEDHGDLLSDLGKRRAELYIEAVEYFVPDALGKDINRKPISMERIYLNGPTS